MLDHQGNTECNNLSSVHILLTSTIHSLVAQLVKNLLAMQETLVGFLGQKDMEDPEGWDGEGGRRGDQDGEHM